MNMKTGKMMAQKTRIKYEARFRLFLSITPDDCPILSRTLALNVLEPISIKIALRISKLKYKY